MAVANARTMSSSASGVGWLVPFGTQIRVLAMVSRVIFVDDAWFGPGEAGVAGMGFLVALWLAAVAFTIVAAPQSPGSPLQSRSR